MDALGVSGRLNSFWEIIQNYQREWKAVTKINSSKCPLELELFGIIPKQAGSQKNVQIAEEFQSSTVTRKIELLGLFST